MTPALKTYIESWIMPVSIVSKPLKSALCANFDPIFAPVDPLNINAYAVQGRYPDSNLMPTPAEAKSYYQLALQVQGLITERITFS